MKNLPKTWNKVLRFFFAFTVVFIIIFYIVLSGLIINSERREYTQEAEKRIENIAYNVGREFNTVYDISESISKNTILHEAILKNDTKSEYYEEYLFIKRFFDSFANYSSAEINFCIYPVDRLIPENMYIENLSKLKNNTELTERLLEMAEDEVLWYDVKKNNDTYILIYRQIKSQNQLIGYLETGISLGFINEIMGDADTKNNEVLQLFSPESKILYSNVTDNKKADFLFERNLIGGYKIQLQSAKIDVYSDSYQNIALITIFIVTLIVLCYFLYSTFISKQLGSFYKFVDIIEADEQKLLKPEKIETDYDADTLRIVEKFKGMAIKLNRMHLNIEQINKEKKEIELKMQQSSINPHLLYNSLSVLNWRMSEYNDTEMTSLINYMVQYYRSVLSDGESFISIYGEIKMIKEYLEIIRLAYEQSFDVNIDVDDEIKDAYTIKQILQPIVENAVMHGLRKVEDAKLAIRAFKRNDKIVFEVEDNGHGMSQREVELALAGKEYKGRSKNRGYGLKNIRECIRFFYGDECGIGIDSELGVGTKVTVVIKHMDKETIKEMI